MEVLKHKSGWSRGGDGEGRGREGRIGEEEGEKGIGKENGKSRREQGNKQGEGEGGRTCYATTLKLPSSSTSRQRA